MASKFKAGQIAILKGIPSIQVEIIEVLEEKYTYVILHDFSEGQLCKDLFEIYFRSMTDTEGVLFGRRE